MVQIFGRIRISIRLARRRPLLFRDLLPLPFHEHQFFESVQRFGRVPLHFLICHSLYLLYLELKVLGILPFNYRGIALRL